MVYSSPFSNDDLSILAGPPATTTSNDRAVSIYYNGTGLHNITGPTPFININKKFNRDNAGTIENILTSMTLSGKIVRSNTAASGLTPPGTGTAAIIGAVDALQKLFSCGVGNLTVYCGNSGIINATGVRVEAFSASKSNDNWIFSADYEIALEYNEPVRSGGYRVKNTSDSWTIEPLEDYAYTSFKIPITQKQEYHNPKLKPTPPTDAAPKPDGGQTQQTGPVKLADIDLQVTNIPQFRISRKLSAVGFPTSPGTGNICASGNAGIGSYLEAKGWVMERLATTFHGSSSVSGMPYFTRDTTAGSLSNFEKTFVYNHLRSTEFSITDGSYSVNETWLAMPTGIKYIEDYTIEASTDTNFIKTVRVQGSVKGLNIASFPMMEGGSGKSPTGIIPSGSGGYIDLSYSVNPDIFASGRFISDQHPILDIVKTSTIADSQSHVIDMSSSKYINAASGWLNDIKPYLYRRAHIAVNSPDRGNELYIDPAASPPRAPRNPVYCRENILNIIPVSTTEAHDPRKGSINYTYEFNNKFTLISGVLAENVNINDTGPIDVINEAFVLGRRLGPVLQSLGSKTSSKKDITVEVFVMPPTGLAGFTMTNKECPLWTGGTVYTTIIGIIEGLKPFGDRSTSIFGNLANETRTGGPTNVPGQVYTTQDNQTWNPTEGRFSRSVSWTYQTCTNARSYLDN